MERTGRDQGVVVKQKQGRKVKPTIRRGLGCLIVTKHQVFQWYFLDSTICFEWDLLRFGGNSKTSWPHVGFSGDIKGIQVE